MGRIILLVWAVLSTGILLAQPNMILVKDINPGPPSSSPNSMLNLNNKLVFLANDGISGVELWISDGSTAGTTLLKDINPGPAGGGITGSINHLGNELWFTANDGVHGTEIWKTDGTTAGTVMVADIRPGSASVFVSQFVYHGNNVYFSVDDGTHGYELWKYDYGTSVASIVKDLNPGIANSGPTALTVFNNQIYFIGFNSTYGTEIFKSDGTESGTDVAVDYLPGFPGSNPSNLMKAGDKLYFVRNIAFNVNALYSSDGNTATELMQSNTFQLMTEFIGKLAFLSNQRNGGANNFALDLTITDGTVAGTILLRSFGFLESLSINPYELCPVNNTLFFRAGTTIAEGLELWKTDGTSAGTMLVRDMKPGAGAFPTNLTNVNGILFFTADPLVMNFYRICRSDGTFAGTINISQTAYGFTNRPVVRYSNGAVYMGTTFSNQNIGAELIRTPDGAMGALPVNWVDFTAIIQNSSVLLQWKTAREINNDHFVIERSVNGVDYNSIGNKEPDKSINDSKNYQFTDNTPNQGINYYRIKQVDHDGKFSYSRVARVNLKAKMGIQITPNPSTDFILISMDASLNPVTIRIFDPGGRLVFNKTNVVLSPMRISVDHLPKGLYVLETQRKNEKHTQKFFKQ